MPTRCEAMRFISPMRTRMTWAFSGIFMPHSFSTASE